MGRPSCEYKNYSKYYQYIAHAILSIIWRDEYLIG